VGFVLLGILEPIARAVAFAGPIGGCDPPQPASNAAEALMVKVGRLRAKLLMRCACWSNDGARR
jgi:hypothetical protein